jgi:hypothetical protein
MLLLAWRLAGWLVEEGGGRRIREGSDGPGLQTLTHSLLRLLASPTIPRAHYIARPFSLFVAEYIKV